MFPVPSSLFLSTGVTLALHGSPEVAPVVRGPLQAAGGEGRAARAGRTEPRRLARCLRGGGRVGAALPAAAGEGGASHHAPQGVDRRARGGSRLRRGG